jgi:putative endonuclease
MKLNVLRPPSQWRDPRHREGLAGELVAARHLQSLGWTILAHRFRFGRHDVDLIARRDEVVAFVEVKARRSTTFGSGAESVRWRKQAILRLVAAVWIARSGRPGERYRFDLVVVTWPGQGPFPHVFHLEDAWRGG